MNGQWPFLGMLSAVDLRSAVLQSSETVETCGDNVCSISSPCLAPSFNRSTVLPPSSPSMFFFFRDRMCHKQSSQLKSMGPSASANLCKWCWHWCKIATSSRREVGGKIEHAKWENLVFLVSQVGCCFWYLVGLVCRRCLVSTLKSGEYFCTGFDTVVSEQVFHDLSHGALLCHCCFMLALVLFDAVLL